MTSRIGKGYTVKDGKLVKKPGYGLDASAKIARKKKRRFVNAKKAATIAQRP